MSSVKEDWETPQWLFDELDREFGFTLDVAANQENAKCSRWLGPGSAYCEDALDIWGRNCWWHEVCWCNPPYGRNIGRWLGTGYLAAYHNRSTVVFLVPARTDTRWWWDYARLGEVRFLPGRLKFGGSSNSAPFPSAVVVFRKGLYAAPKTIYWEPTQKLLAKEGRF